MDFCLLLKIWVKMLVKSSVKTYAVSIIENFLIMLSNLQQMHLKLLQKEAVQKTAEGSSDFIDNKIAIKITKVSKNS